MPLTAKGEKILASMREQYGTERGEEVFYRSKNAGTIEGVDAGEVEREGEGLREQLRAAQEGMNTARTSAAKASYKAECDRLTARIADMEKADAATIMDRIDAMGAHIAGHVGKGGSQPVSIKHADRTALLRAEAKLDARSDATPYETARGHIESIFSEGQIQGRELLEKLKGMSGGRGDASKSAGQDSPLDKLEDELEEMKLHNKLGGAFMKHCDELEKRLDTYDGYVRAGQASNEDESESKSKSDESKSKAMVR